MFDHYLVYWGLTPDGEPIITHSSMLLPVRRGDAPAMLKIATEAEERRGAAVMIWWNGQGAARVIAHEGDALLMERALGEASLVEMARNGRDDEASRILCAVAAKLHEPRDCPPPSSVVPLSRWFEALGPAASKHGGVLGRADATARELLAEPQEVVVLHGDIHHGNVLDAGPLGWLAIDPKGLVGERGFDFANIFCNPDLEIATAPGRLARQAGVVADAAGLDRVRLLKWILAYAGLSAAWILLDGERPELELAVAELAASELATSSALSPLCVQNRRSAPMCASPPTYSLPLRDTEHPSQNRCQVVFYDYPGLTAERSRMLISNSATWIFKP
jgi:streptomycin 6-kinase